jgi:quercetin dioxygenase-like cupin family protein
MTKQLLCLALGIAVGAAGLALAQHDTNDKAPGKARFKPLLEQELKDMLNGKQGKIVVLELTSAPGSASRPHRHPGPVVGYVLEGELEVAVDDGPVKVYKKGEAWFEPGRALHRVNRNPSKTKPARFLAFMLMTAEDKHLVLPAKE